MKQRNWKSVNCALLAAAALMGSPALFAQSSVSTTTTTTSAGTVTELGPDTLVIRGESGDSPARYAYTKSTTYVDESGAPVSIETVRSGLPVTVYYVKEGDRLIASKVVVRKKTTSRAPAVVEEHKTTTTTTETK